MVSHCGALGLKMLGNIRFVMGKVAWGAFSPITLVSPASSHFTECTILIWACNSGPTSGQNTKWTQSLPTPMNLKYF
jgi:hypothetical protein